MISMDRQHRLKITAIISIAVACVIWIPTNATCTPTWSFHDGQSFTYSFSGTIDGMNLSMACVTLKVNENNTGDVINYTVTFTTSFGNIAYKMQGYSSFLNGTWNVSQSANNFFWIAPSGYLTDHVHQKFKNITGNDFIGAGITFENDVYYFRISYNISGTYFFFTWSRDGRLTKASAFNMTAQSIIYTLETIPDGTVCPSFIQREFITTVASAGITAAGIGIIVGARKVHRARHVTKKRS